MDDPEPLGRRVLLEGVGHNTLLANLRAFNALRDALGRVDPAALPDGVPEALPMPPPAVALGGILDLGEAQDPDPAPRLDAPLQPAPRAADLPSEGGGEGASEAPTPPGSGPEGESDRDLLS